MQRPFVLQVLQLGLSVEHCRRLFVLDLLAWCVEATVGMRLVVLLRGDRTLAVGPPPVAAAPPAAGPPPAAVQQRGRRQQQTAQVIQLIACLVPSGGRCGMVVL